MKTSVFRFSLDVSQTQSQVSVSAGVGETGIRLIARLTENGAPFEIEPGSYAVFSAVKPDGQPIFNDCMIFSTGTVVYDFTEQTVALPGIVRCQIFVYAPDGTLIISPRLQLVVHDNVYNKDIESTMEYKAIKKFVEEINRVDTELSTHAEQIGALEGKITTTGHITVPATVWTDTDPHDALLPIPGDSFTNGGLLLIAPEDDETREACARARISVKLDMIADKDPPFYDYVWFLRAESGEIPDSPLNFVYFGIRTGTKDQKAVAAIIGVDAYGGGITEETKEELVKYVLAALPVYDGEVEEV